MSHYEHCWDQTTIVEFKQIAGRVVDHRPNGSVVGPVLINNPGTYQLVCPEGSIIGFLDWLGSEQHAPPLLGGLAVGHLVEADKEPVLVGSAGADRQRPTFGGKA